MINTDGDIFYTVEQESDYGTNLQTGPYKNSYLGKVFREISSLTYGEVEISNIEYYEPSDKLTGFFVIPVFKDPHDEKKELIGVLAAQISLDRINEMLLKRTGLGKTGEVLLAQRDENGGAIFFTIRRFEEDETALPSIPKERLEVPMTQALLKNETVLSDVVDYRNEKVLAATRYISEADWGLVAKLDEKEAFTPIVKFRNFDIAVGAITLVLLIILGIIFAKAVSRPIHKLASAALNIAKGKFDTPIEISSKDEIGELAAVFSKMATTLRLKEKEKYEFITSASHQIRTPASGVRNALQLLREEIAKTASNSEQMKIINDLIKNNGRVIKITNNLFKTLELGSDYKAGNISSIKLKEMITKIVDSFKKITTSKMLEVDIEVPAELRIEGEESRIKIALINLIENAIQYSSEGGKINIKANKKDNQVFIEIEDTGIGIPQEEQIHIFEEFFRAENAYLSSSVGSGLGLVIAKKIIEGHGGEIRFNSQEDKGTTFIFSLPTA